MKVGLLKEMKEELVDTVKLEVFSLYLRIGLYLITSLYI